MVLLRFAPSPTGSLHLGGLRTALFNHLTARRLGGKWLLRIEDTDAARFVQGSVEGIQRALEWAGLDYDYGPSVGGPHAPYFQSQRRDLYHAHAKSLLEKGHAYRCFCSPDRLASAHAELKARGSNATYDRHCLHMSEEEVARKVRAGERNILRLNIDNVPDRKSPQDLIFGQLKDAHASLATDPVLLKSDGLPTYHLANVVDDHEMGITHVLRGEEWLPSLPLHLDLYACLDFPPPQFAHLPLLLNKDGSKLSKRHGDVSVGDYIEKGWEPGALLNWLAVTGWGTSADSKRTHKEGAVSAPDSTAIFTLQELTREFDIKSLTRRRTILDPSKLEIINQEHIKRIASTPDGRSRLQEEALRLTEKYLDVPKGILEWGPLDADKIFDSVVEGSMTNMKQFPEKYGFLFLADENLYAKSSWKSMNAKSVSEENFGLILDKSLTFVENTCCETKTPEAVAHELAKELKPFKGAMTVMRYALTGQKVGPPIADVIELLGVQRTLNRLRQCKKMSGTLLHSDE